MTGRRHERRIWKLIERAIEATRQRFPSQAVTFHAFYAGDIYLDVWEGPEPRGTAFRESVVGE